MSDTDEKKSRSGGKFGLILGIALAAVGAGGGFYATYEGFVFAKPPENDQQVAVSENSDLADITFIPIDPISVSLPSSSPYRHLRFRGELEVKDSESDEVEKVMPRIVDVLNGYLRAVRVEDLEEPLSLMRLKEQMLHRARLVAGPQRVDNLLVMEFVLN